MPNLTGQSIGRYQILEQLGEGGMAIVYKAYDTRLERNVAFKVLRTDLFSPVDLDQVLKRFEREAKSLAKLSHPNIVNILDYGEYEGNPYLVMEYLPGGTLKQKLGHIIPWQDAIQILLPVASGLAYAHQHNVIHRDVKPANILMDENNAPILTDFGVAKLLEGANGHTVTASGVGIGTPEYMAPEQGIGAHEIDARADIYSLGIVLFEMVTGRKPYMADTPMAVILKQMTDPLPRPTDFVPDLPESVEHILFKALAKLPEDRYTDMGALIAAMESVLSEEEKVEAQAATEMVMERAVPHIKPTPKLFMAVIGILTAISAIVFGASRMRQQFLVAPEATSTVISMKPSLFTLTPLPSSPTLELIPSPKPTETLQPAITHTPVPAWVTSFAEPILAAIKDRKPDFQDDFSSNESRGWYAPSRPEGNLPVSIADGVMRLKDGGSASNIYIMKKVNYILRVDISPPASCCVHVEIGGDNSIYLGNSGWGICRQNLCTDHNYTVNQKIQVTVIVRNSEAGFYINGRPIFHLVDSELATQRYSIPQFRCGDNSCEFDNLKFWNLDKVNPSVSTTNTTASAQTPSWVTDFAEPIMAVIKDRKPDFQDDFSTGAGGWKAWGLCRFTGYKVNYGNGEMTIDPGGSCWVWRDMWYPPFVAKVDARFLPGASTSSSWDLSYRHVGGGEDSWSNGYQFRFTGDVVAALTGPNASRDDVQHIDIPGAALPGLGTNHILIIAKNQTFALYINDIPVFYTIGEPVWANGGFRFDIDDKVALDNLEIWDISDLKIP